MKYIVLILIYLPALVLLNTNISFELELKQNFKDFNIKDDFRYTCTSSFFIPLPSYENYIYADVLLIGYKLFLISKILSKKENIRQIKYVYWENI